jgi:hypothetical protein
MSNGNSESGDNFSAHPFRWRTNPASGIAIGQRGLLVGGYICYDQALLQLSRCIASPYSVSHMAYVRF